MLKKIFFFFLILDDLFVKNWKLFLTFDKSEWEDNEAYIFSYLSDNPYYLEGTHQSIFRFADEETIVGLVKSFKYICKKFYSGCDIKYFFPVNQMSLVIYEMLTNGFGIEIAIKNHLIQFFIDYLFVKKGALIYRKDLGVTIMFFGKNFTNYILSYWFHSLQILLNCDNQALDKLMNLEIDERKEKLKCCQMRLLSKFYLFLQSRFPGNNDIIWDLDFNKPKCLQCQRSSGDFYL